MEAKELRIGNYLKQKNDIFNYCVKSFSGNSMINVEIFGFSYTDDKNYLCVLTGLEPIPITEEWLEKLGFEDGSGYHPIKCTAECYYINEVFIDRVTINLQRNNRSEVVKITFDRMDLEVELKYVHQLQNLYFALTGEELTFKTEGETNDQNNLDKARKKAWETLDKIKESGKLK